MLTKENVLIWLRSFLKYTIIFAAFSYGLLVMATRFNMDWLALSYICTLGFFIVFGIPGILIYKYANNNIQEKLTAILLFLAIGTFLILAAAMIDSNLFFGTSIICGTAIIIFYLIYKLTSGKTKIILSVIVSPAIIAAISEIFWGKDASRIVIESASTIFAIVIFIIITRYIYSVFKNNDISEDVENEKIVISTIDGKLIYGLNGFDNEKIRVFLYNDELIFKVGSNQIEVLTIDDSFEVSARRKEEMVGTTTIAHREVGLASTLAMLKGDWAMAYFLSPNTTTYKTRPDVEVYWSLWIECDSGLYVVQAESESKLYEFVEACNNVIAKHQEELNREEAEEITSIETSNIANTKKQDVTIEKSEKISIDGMTGTEFEIFCIKLLSKSGYFNIIHTGGANDQGTDITASKDGITYAFQCKCYGSPLGNTPIQEVLAGKQFRKCHVGVVITNSTFTKGAKELAESTQIILWDRIKLMEMINETDLKDEYLI